MKKLLIFCSLFATLNISCNSTAEEENGYKNFKCRDLATRAMKILYLSSDFGVGDTIEDAGKVYEILGNQRIIEGENK